MNDDQKSKPSHLIQTGAELAGAAVGGALGFLAGGPYTAAGAGVAGVVIARVSSQLLTDLSNRVLSAREEVRVGAAAAEALSAIKEKIDAGEAPRTDGFFDETTAHRSDADEIFEGVLLTAKNEHQEKKIRFIANIFAQVSFAPNVSVGEANHVLTVAERMTYRQICLLAMLWSNSHGGCFKLRKEDYRKPNVEIRFETVSTLQEIFELYHMGFVACLNENGTGNSAMLGWPCVAPDKLRLTPLGIRFGQLLSLREIPSEDILTIAEPLTG